MAHLQQGIRPPVKAASDISQYVAVSFLAGGSSLSETVIRSGTHNEFPIGVTIATAASPGDPVSMALLGDTVKGIAGASLGAGAFVGVGSTNGVLAPLGVVAAGPTGPARFAVCIALKNAAPGDYFPVWLNPAQIV